MTVSRELLSDPSSSSLKPVTSSSGTSEKRLADARATLGKNLNFRSKRFTGKSNVKEQQVSIPGGRGRSEAPPEDRDGGIGGNQVRCPCVGTLLFP